VLCGRITDQRREPERGSIRPATLLTILKAERGFCRGTDHYTLRSRARSKKMPTTRWPEALERKSDQEITRNFLSSLERSLRRFPCRQLSSIGTNTLGTPAPQTHFITQAKCKLQSIDLGKVAWLFAWRVLCTKRAVERFKGQLSEER
jgi:hypothetical protein